MTSTAWVKLRDSWRRCIAGFILAVATVGLPALSPQVVLADADRRIPPLPDLAPRLLPPATFGYNRHTAVEMPTVTEKWIDVDLSEQRVVAYEGVHPVRSFVVSTGKERTPTIQGTFRMNLKTRIQDMSGGSRASGDYYYLEDVEWVQYFYDEYAFHGTWWHSNFGQPMSRGCVNMRNEDARWLWEWAGPEYDMAGPSWQRPTVDQPGTLVVVHE
jgi:lipoprotein-anchoring transpeptidase ErfK/SrfK